MNRTILPSRPLRMRMSSFGRAVFAVIAFALIGLGCAYGVFSMVRSATRIVAEQRVWERGVRAEDGLINAHRTYKLATWLMANYDGTVEYVDAEGKRHKDELSFWTLFGGPDIDDTELRYDPTDPSKFATSWGVAASGARWRGVIVLSLILLLCTWACFAASRWSLGDYRGRRRVVAEGDDVLLRIVTERAQMHENKPTGKIVYQLELDVNGEPKVIHRECKPLLTFGSRNHLVIGVWLPPDTQHLVAVERDFAPLVLSDAERMAIIERTNSADR